MKSLATAGGAKDNLNTKASDSYKVPATNGRMVEAKPLKFCLNFRKQNIGVVYSLESKSKNSGKGGKARKYIHEVKVDFDGCKNLDINSFDLSKNQDKDRKPTK